MIFFKNNKKALSELVTILLLLVVASISFVVIFNWFIAFQSDLNAKGSLENNIGKLDIIGIKTYQTTTSQIGVRNNGGSYHIINKVLINKNNCNLLSTNVVEDVDVIYTSCSFILGQNYDIELFSDKGVFSKTLTALE